MRAYSRVKFSGRPQSRKDAGVEFFRRQGAQSHTAHLGNEAVGVARISPPQRTSFFFGEENEREGKRGLLFQTEMEAHTRPPWGGCCCRVRVKAEFISGQENVL